MLLTKQGRKNAAKRREEESFDSDLLEDYYATLRQLRKARLLFEQTSDPELVSACVFEINALQERYSSLLHRLREEHVCAMGIVR